MSITEPIAVIGIGCRFPGGANSPEKLWEVLSEGRDTWSSVPEERFNWKSFHHPDGEAPGALNHLGGHFIDGDIAKFDGKFFGLPPQECEAIDPQFRFQLEVTYEALENAGLRLEDLRGSDTAVYVATFGQDYAHMQDRDLETISKYYMTGTGLAMASNRISYLLDLRGPSVTLDTGCSGSMVAIHQACQSLRTGEAKIAVAGGVSLIITPDMMDGMSKIGVLNKDGKSYSFDSRGAGYGRGEGAAMVVLKNLSEAIRDGDHIRGVIRNSGVNQDGKTPGITVPSRDAQLQLIRRVYQQVNLNPLHTKYAEAHGTGTIAGDDAEIWALRQAFNGRDAPESSEATPLHVGSLKPNIGHLESASGAASLIKAILMLENDAMPPVINLKVLKDSCKGSDILIPTTFEAWDKSALRRISVNNFGYGGTNGHLILDSLSTYKQELLDSGHINGESKHHQSTNGTNGINGFNGFHEPEDVKPHPQVLTLSAKSKDSMVQTLENLEQWISQSPDLGEEALRNLAHTLSTRRSLFRWRSSLVGISLPDILSRLRSGRPQPTRSVNKSQNVFVFTGQGAQWFAMGRELMGIDSPFSRSLKASEQILREFGASWSLIEELSHKRSSDSRVNESQIAQPATTALQIALIDLLSSLDIKPDIVVGHSSGEIGAAYAAKSLSQSSALKAAYYRGRLQVSASLKGAMMAVGMGEEQLSPYISRVKSGKLVVACSNSPESSTVSGDEAAILELKDILDADTVFARRLAVDTAYHSHHVMSVSEIYLHNLDGLEHGETSPDVRFISSVTGEEKTTGFGADYWVSNLVSKVRFQTGVEEVCRKASSISPQAKLSFVEIGPHNALSGPLRQTMSSLTFSPGYSSVSVLLRNQDARYTLLETAGKLFDQGSPVDIEKANLLFEPKKTRNLLIGLPTYSWDHSENHWHESRLSKAHRFRKDPHHDLLGSRMASSTVQNPMWRHMLGIDQLPWLREHVIDGFMIFPASGYLSMAIQALLQSSVERYGSLDISSYNFRNVKFAAALLIPESSKSIEIQLALATAENLQDSSKSRWEEFKVSSVSAQGTSVEHCHGFIMAYFSSESDEVEAAREQEMSSLTQAARLHKVESVCKEEVDRTKFYHDMEATGNKYSGNFACIEKISLGDTEALSVVNIPDTSQCMPAQFQQPHVIHPSTLDAVMHHPVAIINRHTKAGSLMVVGIDDLKISSRISSEPGTSLTIATTTENCSSRFPSADVSVFQLGSGLRKGPVVQMKALKFRATGDTGMNALDNEDRNISYNMEWDLDADYMTSSMFNPGPDSLAAERTQELKLQLLNQAAAIYVRSCLDKITVDGPPKLSDHFPHLFDWMKRFNQSEESKSLLQGVSNIDEGAILESAHKQGVEGELAHRLGFKLEGILTGKVDALSLMIEDNLLFRVYSDDSSARIYAHVIQYMKKLAFKNPTIRVLELGGGTAATTGPLLEALGPDGVLPFEKYVFTDVSSGFFERTRERLKKWDSFMEYKKLDMNSGFLEQGFESESYDLIIGANCIHIASAMDSVMSNIRQLLKPGGKIVMIETTRVVPFYTTFMGVFDGWWAGVEDGRIDGPTLTVDEWHTTLLRNSFNGAELVATDFEGTAQRSAMIVSTAVNSSKEKPNGCIELVLPPSWESDPPELALCLSSKLRHQGFDTSIVSLSSAMFQGDTTYIILDNGSNPLLTTDDPSVFTSIKSLLSNATRVLWISSQDSSPANMNPEKGMIAGLARVCRAENPFLHLITINVQDTVGGDLEHLIQTIGRVVEDGLIGVSSNSPKELEYIYMNQEISIPRLIANTNLNDRIQQAAGKSKLQLQPFYQPNRPLKLHVNKPGFLDSLSFVDDGTLANPLPASHIEVRVEACGINFKDVLIALGQVNEDIPMAGEFSGVITEVGSQHQYSFQVGDRVCGFGGSSYTSIIRLDGRRVSRIPPSMAYEVAASIPVVFTTAYHALVDIANLRCGQTVLIQSATGGVGQAALRIAQNIGAEVFATVGSAAKRELLIEKFGIPEDHIFSSKLLTFKEGIYRMTNGKGVDVVLNSLSGEALRDSWDCIARFGSFIELGKADSLSKLGLSTKPFERNVTFSSLNLQLICDYNPEKAASLLHKVVNLFGAGFFVPIQPINTMPITDIAEAFRLVQAREHTGKIVLKTDSETSVMAPAMTTDNLIVSNEGTYLIAGGLGDLGLEIALMIAKHGARHIAILSRRHLQNSELVALEKRFRCLGTEVVVLNCDITNLSSVKKMVSSIEGSDMPPIKGVVQASNVLQDRVFTKMELEDFKISTAPKCTGTANLVTALGGQPLEFFLMLASISSVVGTIAQGNYAAGNNYMDTLAYNNKVSGTSSTHFVAVDFGPLDDAGVIANSQRTKDGLVRQGYILLKLKELLALISYAISHSARDEKSNQFILGVDYKSILDSDNKYTLKNPMFAHLSRQQRIGQSLEKDGTQIQSIESLISATDDITAIRLLISGEIAKKISKLVAIDSEEVDIERSMADFGLDSLVSIELKNWITQTFKAKLQASEISDAAHIVALAGLVASRSAIISKKEAIVNENEDQNERRPEPEVIKHKKAIIALPKQPLPDLDSSLDQFLNRLLPILSPKEYTKYEDYVNEFRTPLGFGRKLQARLSKLFHDPRVDNWLGEFYTTNIFLKSRRTLVPWSNYFATHFISPFQHTAAERAAIISSSAFQFKQDLEAGKLAQQFFNDQPTSSSAYKWFFNATREPGEQIDAMRKYPGNDYLVAFRRGHVYKIPLLNKNEAISFAALRDSFQSILDANTKPESLVGFLTQDSRDNWASNRIALQDISEANKTWIRDIEAAAFIVYLDEARPQNSSERGPHFLHANGLNRWSDKTIQFSVCDNGISATIGDHTMLDGVPFMRLNTWVSDSIVALDPKDIPAASSSPVNFSEYTFKTTPKLEEHIKGIRTQLNKDTARFEYQIFEIPTINREVFRQHKCPPNSGAQLALQLAARRYWGHNPLTVEPVSQNHFYHGRIDVNVTPLPSTTNFCTAVAETKTATKDIRKLFFDAARAHSASVMAVARGHGFDRHFLALKWAVRDDETVPALLTDPIYRGKRSPPKLMLNCMATGEAEGGDIFDHEDMLSINFEVMDDRTKISVWGNVGKVDRFREILEESAKDVKAIVES